MSEELDREVAEKVMGWKPVHLITGDDHYWLCRPEAYEDMRVPIVMKDGKQGKCYLNSERLPNLAYALAVPKFSTDISAAWQVVEKMGISVIASEDGWYAGVTKDVIHTCDNAGHEAKEVQAHFVLADTAPLAICRAALSALDRGGATSPTPEGT